MNRAVLGAGTVLILFGAGVFAWKALVLDLPVMPVQHPDIWHVTLVVTARGEGADASLRAVLPNPGPSQRVFGESFSSGRLRLSVRDEEARRMAVWHGWIEDTVRVYYDFRIQLFRRRTPIPSGPYQEPGRELRERYTATEVGLPASAPEIREQLTALDLPRPEEIGARVRTIYAFVVHEIGDAETSGDDPLLVLAMGSGSREGRERLLATLLRGSGIPARLAQGMSLAGSRPKRLLWTEVWVDGSWVPMSASEDFFEQLPPDTVVLSAGTDPIVQGSGVRDVGFTYQAVPERLGRDELATIMLPPDPILRRLSLYRLSVPMQEALRILLLLPVAALAIAVMRNLVGVPSYGTFMPMLIALSMRGTGLLTGLLMLGLVVAIGIVGRMALGRLRLLLVPRLSILMSVVILCVAGLGLIGRGTDSSDFYAGVIFPIVILTMVIERFSIIAAEEGIGEALTRLSWSVALAILVYPLFRWTLLQHLMFGFPELVFCVMGMLCFLGGYMGYRVTDLLRFRVVVLGDAR